MDPSRITQIAQTIHTQLPDIWSIYVYGSQASNKALPESDLDVAVLGGQKISSLKLSETAQSTGISLQTQIDLVDLRSVPTDLQAQIVFKGKRTLFAEGKGRAHSDLDLAYDGENLDPEVVQTMCQKIENLHTVRSVDLQRVDVAVA